MDKLFLMLVTLLVTFQVTHARDPDVEYEPRYGERHTVGGSKWSVGDYWVVGGVMTIAVMLVALPVIFDGKDLGRIASWDAPGSGFGDKVTPLWGKDPSSPLSPRDLTSDPIPVPNGWVLPLESNRKSGYPPFFKFPTRSLCGSY